MPLLQGFLRHPRPLEHGRIRVPNYVDAVELDRAKIPGARFHLGLLGAVPKRKRLDLALDLVAELRLSMPM